MDLDKDIMYVNIGYGLDSVTEIAEFFGLETAYRLSNSLAPCQTPEGIDQRFLLLAFMMTIPDSMRPPMDYL